mmetsp:Transcript_12858/g.40576  ORF Transcript_12858/g.40576 Transcript_12858/m.40576 type:complete len:425 (+) Transcript_12858:51-1325(+)
MLSFGIKDVVATSLLVAAVVAYIASCVAAAKAVLFAQLPKIELRLPGAGASEVDALWGEEADPLPGTEDPIPVGFLTLGSQFLGQAMRAILVIEAMTRSPVRYYFITDAEKYNDPDGAKFMEFMKTMGLTYTFNTVPEDVWTRVHAHGDAVGFSERPRKYVLKLYLHRIMPPSLDRIIMLDTDVIVFNDIASLNRIFDDFSESTLMGLTMEQQPTYRNCFSAKAFDAVDEHSRGYPFGKSGFPGFNGGLQLQNLNQIRRSACYNAILDDPRLLAAVRPHNPSCALSTFMDLGDQDLLSIVANQYPHWFRILPCTWNWQACRFWQNYYGLGYFERQPFDCPATPSIFHGNCNFPGIFNQTNWKSWVLNLQRLIWFGRFKEAKRSASKYNLSFSGVIAEEVWARLHQLRKPLVAAHLTRREDPPAS